MKPARILLISAIVIVVFLSGIWLGGKKGELANQASNAAAVARYTCPMHPQYIVDKPGDCPSCGMRLVPMDDKADHNSPDANMSSGSIHISPEKQQLIGVRVSRVERTEGANTLRSVGRVAPDETRTYVINATVDGWITSTLPNSTGSFVKKNEVLATFYSPEFLSAVQALMFALNSADRVRTTGKENPAQKDQLAQFQINLQQYKDSLRNLGMGEIQIQELIKNRQYTERIDITSPAAGFILVRKVSDGLRFNKGDEMYRIADLSRVWILVDIFENEEKYLQPGEKVKINLPNQGRVLSARVTNILPQFDPNTRTLKVRLDAENPGFRLRPEMFVDVELPVRMPESLVIPAGAVIDTGLRKTVFVDRGNGRFEPRRVETGWRFGDRIEITKGLMEGESIVVSGNFLVDSESRIKMAAAGLPEDYVVDPVCGMDVDPRKAGNKKTDYKNQTYYFCSDLCKVKFDKDPGKYSGQLAAGNRQEMSSESQKKSAKDLVCGMDVDISMPGTPKAEYKGKTYYFCSDFCKKSFQADPEKYMAAAAKMMAPHDTKSNRMSK
jgi:membrane fusion protein, copper/silver efflux system